MVWCCVSCTGAMDTLLYSSVFGFGISLEEESDAVVFASFLTFPSTASLLFRFDTMSLCCFDFSFVSCPPNQNVTGWLALCCLSKQRIASSHLTSAKEQRQSNGSTKYRSPEDWECSDCISVLSANPENPETSIPISIRKSIPSCILRSILDASPRLFQWGMHTGLPIAPCKFLNLRGQADESLCCAACQKHRCHVMERLGRKLQTK